MTHQSRLKERGLSASALLGLSLAVAASIGPAAADKVGVAAAVNPDAFSSLSGAPQSQLNIGKSIFFNERIKTTDSGLVQVLLVDGSTFTVGPDSDLVIDKFVYDANKGTGQIAASFSKGVMRFVGGKISKSDNAVNIKTPAGAMAIRGCIVLTQVTATNFAAVLVYGDYLKMKNLVVYEPGNGIFIAGNGLPQIKPATGAIINGMMAGLTSSNNQSNNGDAAGKTSNPGTTIQLVDTASLNELISNANTQEITDQAAKAENNQPPSPPPGPEVCETDCGTPKGQLQGYAAGNYISQDHGEYDGGNDYSQDQDRNVEYGTVANHSAEEVNFTFNEDGDDDASNDTFSAKFRLHADEIDSNKGGILINFGNKEPPTNPEDRRSFINPQTGALFAFTGSDGITIFQNDTDTDPAEPIGDGDDNFAVLASHEFFQQSPTNGNDFRSFESHELPEGIELPELCTNCDFLKWGVFAAAAAFEDDESETGRDVGIVGFWVAGDIPAVGQLPFQGSASYAGGAIGTVSTDLFDGPTTYTSKGDMNMNWDFGKRSGNMKISKFDQQHFDGGLTFKGKMCAPGVSGCGGETPSGNHFGGKIDGQLPDTTASGTPIPEDAKSLDGFALGSFARGPDNYNNGDPKTGKPIKGSAPQGVMGNWQVGNDRYKASGVFAGTKQ